MQIKQSYFVLAATLLFAGSIAAADATSTADGADPDESAAATYCIQEGGAVIERVPAYGTNGPESSWLILSGTKKFCQFTSAADGSTIHVLLRTLYTTVPTLAALAYYAAPAYNGGGEGSPGSYYCTQLGGTDLFGGVNAAGGGWVSNKSTIQVLDTCIFPDESSIDSYGLYYNSAGIVRGINLRGVLRYTPPPAKK